MQAATASARAAPPTRPAGASSCLQMKYWNSRGSKALIAKLRSCDPGACV
jgi:hypothetical protein